MGLLVLLAVAAVWLLRDRDGAVELAVAGLALYVAIRVERFAIRGLPGIQRFPVSDVADLVFTGLFYAVFAVAVAGLVVLATTLDREDLDSLVDPGVVAAFVALLGLSFALLGVRGVGASVGGRHLYLADSVLWTVGLAVVGLVAAIWSGATALGLSVGDRWAWFAGLGLAVVGLAVPVPERLVAVILGELHRVPDLLTRAGFYAVWVAGLLLLPGTRRALGIGRFVEPD